MDNYKKYSIFEKEHIKPIERNYKELTSTVKTCILAHITRFILQDMQISIFPSEKLVSDIPLWYYEQKMQILSPSWVRRTIQLNWQLFHPNTAYPGDVIITFIIRLILNQEHFIITPEYLKDLLARVQKRIDLSNLTNLLSS
jgi:hypothetical protein